MSKRKAVTKKDTDAFLRKVHAAIQSHSIRAWAESEHNAPIVRQMVSEYLLRKAGEGAAPDADNYAAYLVAIAMG